MSRSFSFSQLKSKSKTGIFSSIEENDIFQALNQSIITGPKEIQGFEFRPSSCPLCCYAAVWSCLIPQVPRIVWDEEFYFDVGTVLHALTQRFLSKTNFLLGNWSCSVCHHTWGPSLSPQNCPKCNTSAKYEELELYGPLGLKGHCDGILWFSEKSYILEIKTTSMKYIENIENVPWHQDHLVQASLYVEMANQWFSSFTDRRISEICFMYVPRDHPYQFRILKKPYKPDEMSKNVARKLAVDEALVSGNFSKLKCFCAKKSEAWDCEWRNYCFGNTDPVVKMHELWLSVYGGLNGTLQIPGFSAS